MGNKMYRSEELYQKIDKMIPNDKIYPVCIPSYSRPNAKLLHLIKNEDIPVILFIRKEQYNIYKEYEGVFKIVKLNNVNNIGQTRNAIIRYCIKNKIPKIFMLDDDINLCDFTLPSLTSGGKKAMRPYCTHTGGSYTVKPYFFKMWMYYLKEADPKVAISSAGGKSDWWNIRYANQAPVYNSSSTIQCVFINVKLLHKHGINYMDSEVCGIEDYALQYHCMKAGLYTYVVKDLVYDSPTMGSNEGGCDYSSGMVETMTKRMELFMKNVIKDEDKKHITTKITKSGIPSVRFNWNYWRIKEE